MTKNKERSPASDAEVEKVIEITVAYVEDTLEGLVDCAVKFDEEMARDDNAHRARLNGRRAKLDSAIERYVEAKQDLSELRKTRQLTDEDRLLLRDS